MNVITETVNGTTYTAYIDEGVINTIFAILSHPPGGIFIVGINGKNVIGPHNIVIEAIQKDYYKNCIACGFADTFSELR